MFAARVSYATGNVLRLGEFGIIRARGSKSESFSMASIDAYDGTFIEVIAAKY